MIANGAITTNTLFMTDAVRVNTVFQSLVTTRVNGVSITLDSSIIPVEELQLLNSYALMELNLDKVAKKIKYLLDLFSVGKFDELVSQLSSENYTKISKMIYEIRMDPKLYPSYELLRTTISLSFQQLYQSFIIHGQQADCEATIEALKKKEAILDNLTLLKEYLLEMQKKLNTYAFDEVKVTVPMAVIKPEYAKYIQIYGYPKNMIFDTDKLAAIVQSMK